MRWIAAVLCALALAAHAQQKEIKIGFIYDVTGPFAGGGSEAAQIGTKAAIDYIKDHKGRLPAVVLARWERYAGIWDLTHNFDQVYKDEHVEGREHWVAWGGAIGWFVMLPFAIYGLFALMIPATMMIGSFVFAQRPRRRVRARTIPFESGVSQGPPKRQRFTVSFYLTAMLFILFDIEIVFLIILLVAYVYIWRKGALEWR